MSLNHNNTKDQTKIIEGLMGMNVVLMWNGGVEPRYPNYTALALWQVVGGWVMQMQSWYNQDFDAGGHD